MALAEISKYTNFDLNTLLDADKRFELALNAPSSATDYSESYIAWRSTGSELGPNEQSSFNLDENKEIKLCVNNHDHLILVNNIGLNGIEVNDLETFRDFLKSTFRKSHVYVTTLKSGNILYILDYMVEIRDDKQNRLKYELNTEIFYQLNKL